MTLTDLANLYPQATAADLAAAIKKSKDGLAGVAIILHRKFGG